MYRVSVYFAAGISGWQGSLDERDVVFRTVTPWLWLARWVARANLGNCARLAYVIDSASGVVAEYIPERAP
jgi:hypothetical protein